jgi:hypothetical protein
MLSDFALHFGHIARDRSGIPPPEREPRTAFQEQAEHAKKQVPIHRVITRTPRFAGAVAALIAGSFAATPLCTAQADSRPSGGVFDAVLHSGISGVVRDRAGKPQIGVLVQLLDARSSVLARTFTDDSGHYSLPRLGAGLYQVKATTSLYLPTIRPDLRLAENSRAIVNLTLSTLYQALAWLPAEQRTASSPKDDWDWTLRLSANRPLLRLLNPGDAAPGEQNASADIAVETADGPVMVQTAQTGDRGGLGDTRQVSIRSGLRAFGEGGTMQQMVWTSGGSDTRALLFGAQSAVDPSGLDRISTTAAYRQQLSPDRSMLTIVTLTDRPDIVGGGSSGLTTLNVRSASTVHMGDLAEISAGAEWTAARFGNGQMVTGSQPFAQIMMHPGNTTTIEYEVLTSPTMEGADRMEEQAQQDEPALSAVGGNLYLEQGLHQEISVTRSVGKWTGKVGVFDDSLSHPVVQGAVYSQPAAESAVLNGTGVRNLVAGNNATLDSSDVLYDPGTGTIAVSGAGYHGAGGVLAMLRNQLNPDTWLSLQYALGEAVTLSDNTPEGAQLSGSSMPFGAQHASSIALAGGTSIPGAHTLVQASYKWQPVDTLTQVAPFDAGAPGPYLGVEVRQPLHLERLSTGRVEAVLEVRNLLAEGYRPFLSADGTMVYFAQAQRCLAAGIAFSF